MSSTTHWQILFNSPALQALERKQLQQLCKIHSIKANGKNLELVEKLKQHALSLPRDAPLSIAARSESASLPLHMTERLFSPHDQSRSPCERTRPSEQWDVVMDSIEETDETSSQGTMGSLRTISNVKAAGEFGTGGSKSSVTSSLKAFATSLGLKRSAVAQSKFSGVPNASARETTSEFNGTDELTKFATPYSSLPPPTSIPQADLFSPQTQQEQGSAEDINMEEPVPGHALRPGAPAPPNARLSLGLGLTAPQTPSKQAQPTTTIRLISNQHNIFEHGGSGSTGPSTPQLAPFKTNFDLIMSPGMAAGIGIGASSSGTTWSSTIYPTLPADVDGPLGYKSPLGAKIGPSIFATDGDVTMPGAFSPPCSPGPSANIVSNAPAAPTGNTLGASAEPFIFGSPLPKHRVSDAQFRDAAASVLDEMNKRLQAEGVDGVGLDIVKRLHPGNAMASQVSPNGFAHKANGSQLSEIKEMFDKKHEAEFARMEGIDAVMKRRTAKPSGPVKEGNDDRVVVGKKRKSSVLADEPRRVPQQVAGRVSGTRVISNGRRSKMIPGAFDDEDYDHEADADEQRGKKRAKMEDGAVDVHRVELEEQMKEKEREAVRRKLEANKARRRSSAAAARHSGRVSIGRAQKQKPSRFGFLAQAKSIVQSVFGRSKTPKAGASTVTAPTASSKAKVERREPEHITKKLTKAPSSRLPVNSSIKSANSRGSLESQATDARTTEQRPVSAARSRSPIPSFNGSTASATGAHVRKPNVLTHSRGNSGSFSDSSSLGPKSSLLPSTGTRGSLANSSAATGSFGVKKVADRGQASLSRLHAPTASSLAKMSGRTSASASVTKASLHDNKQDSRPSVDQKETTLGSITNNPPNDATTNRRHITSPSLTKIFNKPLNPSAYQISGARAAVNEGKNPASSLPNKAPLQRQRALSGRKPRISRSRVISRLASQRANAVSSEGQVKTGARRPSATGKPTVSTARARSSLGARVNKPIGRLSHTGVSTNGDILMSAKKRARQSEYYARRRSRMEAAKLDNPPVNA